MKDTLPGLAKSLVFVLLSSCFTSPILHAQTQVATAKLSNVAIYPTRFAPATVVSLNQPQITALITAQITSVPVEVGDSVQKGETLISLDCEDFQLSQATAAASVGAAQARYVLAQNQLERTRALIDNQLVSVDDLESRQAALDEIVATLQSAKAQLALAELNQSRCEVIAPFDALILGRQASVGQLATPGVPLLSILDLSTLQLSAQIYANDAMRLNQVSSIRFESQGISYPVTLQRLVDALDPSTRNREARLLFSEASALPGSSGRIAWADPRPHLPAEYLIERDGQLGFFIVEQNKARFIAIEGAQPGRSNPTDAPISSTIVTSGYAGLSDGQNLNTMASE